MRPTVADAGGHTLVAGDLEAVFLPGHGMLGASLRHRGVELLRRVEDLEDAAAKGSTAGIPMLHPWANRLGGQSYRVAGTEVALDRSSPLLHFDERGLPIHGVPWSRLAWEPAAADRTHLVARLDWNREELLAIFPFRHRVELAVALDPAGLTMETTLSAGPAGPVPVSFGFHPYVGLPGLRRADWRLTLPAMRRLTLDEQGIPTGEESPFEGFDSALGEVGFDDGFALSEERASLSLAGAGLRITVELIAGYPYTQVFAPADKDYVALEPMTAPTNALRSGRGLRLVEPNDTFRTTCRIRIEETRPLASPGVGAARH
jgi:aldose 1-epimerase